MLNLSELTITKIQKMLADKEVSCREIVTAYLENAKKQNKDVNAYLEFFDDAIKQAEEQDEIIKNGGEIKPLFGVPMAIKDNILIKGKIASASSKMLENYHATYSAVVIERLKNAGAIFLGRTNMDEFAMGASTENSAFGVTKNPRDLDRVSGGSSGGSAAAVAMDGCAVSLGSDTGGSIRQPAGFCGVVGLNPTYGAVSRSGLMAMASSFDQIGPIAKNTEDAEIIFDIIKGKDTMDATSVETKNEKRKMENTMKIGLLKYDRKGVSEEVNKAIDETVEKLKKLGHQVVEVDLPNIGYSIPCYYILIAAEISANLARFDGIRYGLSVEGKDLLDGYMETRARGFGREVKRRIMLGTYVLSAGYYDAYYNRAQKVRALIKKDFKKVFEADKIDAILSPVSPTTAFKIGEKANDPLQMYLEDIFTTPAKLAGLPAISIPYHPLTSGEKSSKLPIGLQFTAPWFREDILFNLGKQYENESGK